MKYIKKCITILLAFFMMTSLAFAENNAPYEGSKFSPQTTRAVWRETDTVTTYFGGEFDILASIEIDVAYYYGDLMDLSTYYFDKEAGFVIRVLAENSEDCEYDILSAAYGFDNRTFQIEIDFYLPKLGEGSIYTFNGKLTNSVSGPSIDIRVTSSPYVDVR